MASFDQAASTYSNGTITISVATGNLIVAAGVSSESLSTLTFSGGGSWTHIDGGGSNARYWRVGYCLATTGSGNTNFDQANEAGDFAWHLHEYSWTSGSYVSGEGQVLTVTNVFDSGDGEAVQTGDILFGGYVDIGASEFSAWNNSFTGATNESSHWSRTAYLIATSSTTLDCSGTIGTIVSARGTWLAVFREGGGASSTPIYHIMNQ